MWEAPDRGQLAGLADVIMVNRYYGWYDLAAAESRSSQTGGC